MPDNIRFDIARDARIGLPEAVFCEHKPFDALLSLFERFAADDEKPILFTHIDEAVFHRLPDALQARYDFDPLSRTAWHRTCPARRLARAAAVSAGTADGFVSHEAARTLLYLGWECRLFEDCGVAGLWRIEEALPEIAGYDAVIAVAGMDAALATVLGGLVGKPIFAVPTSVGYGVCESGLTALRSMLASCAPGIAVFNVDNGYGAACAAARVLRLVAEARGAHQN